MKKYSAHTFAELMISLVVVSIIAALLYPMLAKFTPNSNKPLFQAAYRTLSVIISEIVHANIDGELRKNSDGTQFTAQELCQEFCERANVVAENNVTTCSTICDDDQIITTTNGMRWHFNTNNNDYRISVDVNPSNNDLTSANSDSANINAFDNNGVFTFTDANIVNNAGVYNIQNLKTQDSFWIDIDSKGKILDMSPAGWANLEDSADTLE